MAIEKQASKQPGSVMVTFRVPSEAAATSAQVVGEFTDWEPVAMESLDNGAHELVIDLRGGSAYRFRYLLDGDRWVNDWAADDYVPNDFGSDDSVVVLSAPESAAESSAAAAPKTAAPKKAVKATAKAAAPVKAAAPAKAAPKRRKVSDSVKQAAKKAVAETREQAAAPRKRASRAKPKASND